MDLESQQLAISMMLQDIEEESMSLKGKDRTDVSLPEELLVLEMQKMELSALEGINEDRRVASALTRALALDCGLVNTLEQQEEFTRRDRETALNFEQGHPLPRGGLRVPTPVQSDGESDVLTVAEETQSLTEDGGTTCGEGASVRDSASPRIWVQCVACGDQTQDDCLRAPCGDYYDSDCLGALFEAIASGDQSLFPARCCRQEIPFDVAKNYLGRRLIEQYTAKAEEFSTLNQLYCSNSVCSQFLGSASEHEKGSRTCEACGTKVCTLCKQQDHPSFVPCRNDLDSEAVLTLARNEGWQRCPGCHRMVELEHGCYHMTCLCRTQFCYLCAALWKNCTCPQWEEARLIRAAERHVRVEHNIAADQALNVAHRQAVRRQAEVLRVNHDCAHPHWRIRHGAERCQSCRNRLDRYLLRCTTCQMLACVRCQRNRL